MRLCQQIVLNLGTSWMGGHTGMCHAQCEVLHFIHFLHYKVLGITLFQIICQLQSDLGKGDDIRIQSHMLHMLHGKEVFRNLPRVLRKYVSKEFYLKMEKLQTLLRLSFLVVANIEVCPQGGLWLCRWYSECRPKSFTHIAGWQNRLFHLESKAVNREVGKRTELND